MLSRRLSRRGRTVIALIATAILTWNSATASSAQESAVSGSGGYPALHWESPARKQRTPLWTKVHGTLVINEKGVDFHSTGGHDQLWTFEDIRSVFLTPHHLELNTYMNRSWHRPGTQHYNFDLTKALPPTVAAAVAARIARPIQNADPDTATPAIATIPVRHRTLAGGTNGVLQFRNGGIEYITNSKDDSRSWRWADLETLSNPDPYHLFLFGYRDTYTFDLKAPLSPALFDRATDAIYAHNESIPVYAPGTTLRTNPQSPEMREK